jgi:hypothetical protein
VKRLPVGTGPCGHMQQFTLVGEGIGMCRRIFLAHKACLMTQNSDVLIIKQASGGLPPTVYKNIVIPADARSPVPCCRKMLSTASSSNENLYDRRNRFSVV